MRDVYTCCSLLPLPNDRRDNRSRLIDGEGQATTSNLRIFDLRTFRLLTLIIFTISIDPARCLYLYVNVRFLLAIEISVKNVSTTNYKAYRGGKQAFEIFGTFCPRDVASTRVSPFREARGWKKWRLRVNIDEK